MAVSKNYFGVVRLQGGGILKTHYLYFTNKFSEKYEDKVIVPLFVMNPYSKEILFAGRSSLQRLLHVRHFTDEEKIKISEYLVLNNG